jgi:signal transduction histidine kinase
LRPDAMRSASLQELLQHATDAAGCHMGIPIALTVACNAQPPPLVKTQFYRIAQEALNNASRHSGATEASLNLTCSVDGLFTLVIRDNGRGFVTDVRKAGHFGLENMQARADEAGATLSIDSVIDLGTAVTVAWQEPAAVAQ